MSGQFIKILLLTQYYPPESGSASMKMAELAEFLANEGHHVSVVTGFPNYPKGKIYDGYKMQRYKKENINGVNLIRTPLYMTAERQSFKHRMLNHVSFMLTAIYGGLLAQKPDLIYYYSPPLFLGFSAWLLKKFYRVPTVVEINDLWPQAPIALGVIKSKKIIRIAEFFEKFVYRKTDRLFFYSNTMRKEIIKKGVRSDKTEIHPLWISSEEFSQSSDDVINRIKTEFNLNGKFIIMYAGYIGMAQGLGVVIDAAKEIRENQDILFVLIGDGPEKENLVKKTENLKLNNIRFIPFQPKEKIPAFLSASDVLFAHLEPAPHRLGTIPAKVLAYMSMGKPLIVAARGETEELVENAGCGIAIEPKSGSAVAKAVLSIYENNLLREEMGKRGREQAVKNFDRKILLEKLETRLADIAHGR